MRKITLLIISLLPLTLLSQTVENIVTKQRDDKIDIYYEIAEDNDKQLFFVTIMCKVDGGEKITLKSITGDVGDNVEGGKDRYMATWDVLQDVDELNSAEFFVKIELKEDGSTIKPMTEISKNKWFVGYNMGTITPIGLRVGYIDNWGGFIGVRFGSVSDTRTTTTTIYHQNEFDFYNGTWSYVDQIYNFDSNILSETAWSVTAGISKRILNTGKIQLHVYAGAGYGYWGSYHQQLVISDEEHWIEDMMGDNPNSFFNPGNGQVGYFERITVEESSYIIWDDADFDFGFYFSYDRLQLNLGLGTSNSEFDGIFGLAYKF